MCAGFQVVFKLQSPQCKHVAALALGAKQRSTNDILYGFFTLIVLQ